MKILVATMAIVLSFAVYASASVPSASTSTVECVVRGISDCVPTSAVICPASDIDTIGVTVTVRNVYGDPLPGKTVDCYAIEVSGTFCWCPGESLQTDVTDANGQAFFDFTDFGGCGNVQFGATCESVVFSPCAAIFVASPDMDGDCDVDLTDFAMFAAIYNTTDPCGDFNCNGTVDLGDFALFAAHYTHACP
ncbi:MAG: hypothetical protein PVJ42_00620 [bacterium]|jgi:hypothetical protein